MQRIRGWWEEDDDSDVEQEKEIQVGSGGPEDSYEE